VFDDLVKATRSPIPGGMYYITLQAKEDLPRAMLQFSRNQRPEDVTSSLPNNTYHGNIMLK